MADQPKSESKTNFVTKQAGPLPIYGWLLVGLGAYLLYSYYKKNKAATTGSSSTPTQAGILDANGNPIASNPGTTLPTNPPFTPPNGGTTTTNPPPVTTPVHSPVKAPPRVGGNPPHRPVPIPSPIPKAGAKPRPTPVSVAKPAPVARRIVATPSRPPVRVRIPAGAGQRTDPRNTDNRVSPAPRPAPIPSGAGHRTDPRNGW